MKNKIMIGGTALLLAATSVLGADDMNKDQSSQCCASNDYYQCRELSLDLFGSASLGRYTIEHPSSNRVRDDAELGVGVGLNYFFTRNLGLGVDAYSENTHGTFIDSASASVILRLPIGQSRFAPYIFGGGGGHFEDVKAWFVQAGAGVECRIAPQVGIFLDARWVLPEETKYSGLARLGVRFAF